MEIADHVGTTDRRDRVHEIGERERARVGVQIANPGRPAAVELDRLRVNPRRLELLRSELRRIKVL